MIPLIPTLALAFVSFISSTFVILRIIIPILPPHPLSRRVRPSEFGLPNFRSLSPADKSHVWLASCDVVAIALFTWQVVAEYLSGSADDTIAKDPASAVRLWLALTLRQTCLFVVATLTLVHVRMGRSVALGRKHWMLWAPTFLLVATSTALAAVLAATAVPSFFMGMFAYSTTIAVASSVAFGCLMGTLVVIRRNLAALNELRDPWPPAKEIEKPRPSFATEDIDALKDGSSWITSRASSSCESVSAFSFSTHHSAMPSNASARIMSQNPALASQPSIRDKSSFWFNPAAPYAGVAGRESPVPPVPPLPSPYRPTSPTSAHLNDDPDPFRRHEPRDRSGSQSSWLTEPSTYQPTLTAWSFPTTRSGSPPPATTPDPRAELLPSTTAARSTPIMANAQVLGGYGYDTERHAEGSTVPPAGEIDVSVVRTIGWLVAIWVPLALSLPYLFTVTPVVPVASPAASLLLILSVSLSSPLLALHMLLRSPLPIPTGLFDSYHEPPSAVMRGPSPTSLAPSIKFSREGKRSGSVTIVEGRRSGDVWVSNGDAVDGRGRLRRAMGLLQPVPRLAVLPIGDIQDAELTPPLPMQTEDEPAPVPATPQSENSAELGQMRSRKESKASSYYSGASADAAFQSQIMLAQKHYSALATTLVLPPSPQRRASLDRAAVGAAASGVETSSEVSRPSQHLRTRSVTSITQSRFPMSPPPASPLPPTPPSVRELRERQARLFGHRKSQSQSSSLLNYSFRPIEGDDVAEIDALSAGLLPLLVPGLTVGADVKVREWNWDSPMSMSSKGGRSRGNRSSKGSKVIPSELGGLSSEFSSPQMHSTPPARKPGPRERKVSSHRRHHFSLPSLSLSKDGLHALSTWRNEINRAVDGRTQYKAVTMGETTRRITVYGGEMTDNVTTHLNVVREEEEPLSPTSAAADSYLQSPVSAHTFLPVPPSPTDIPDGVNTARNSLATLITALDQELRMPHSAASDITLFDLDNTIGPQAESTPYELQKARTKAPSQQVPPVPQLPVDTKTGRRSSIVYIASNENAPPTSKPVKLSPKTISEWSSRAVRPLVPKSRAKADKAKVAKLASASANVKQQSPRGGLRPLSLLQDRDVNVNAVTVTETRALTLGKKKKVVADENADPNQNAKGLRPLRLARKDTTKERAALRKDETLPDVIVRPPSGSEHNEYAYTFRS